MIDKYWDSELNLWCKIMTKADVHKEFWDDYDNGDGITSCSDCGKKFYRFDSNSVEKYSAHVNSHGPLE
jgi:hypothetical protein